MKSYRITVNSDIRLPDGTELKKGVHIMNAFFDILESYRKHGIIEILERTEVFDAPEQVEQPEKRKVKGKTKLRT